MQRYATPLYLCGDHTTFSNTRLTKGHKETETCWMLSTVYRPTYNRWSATHRQASRKAHKYWDAHDELTCDNCFLLKGSRVITPPALRVLPAQPPSRKCRQHQVPAHSNIPYLLAQYQQCHGGLNQVVVVPNLHQAITYPSSRAPDPPRCFLRTLPEPQHRLHGVGWQKVAAHCWLFLQISLPFSYDIYYY